METILFEKPLLIGVLGAIAAVVLGLIWLQTTLRPILYGLIAVVMVTIVGIVVARVVVTEREAVHAILQQAAAAVARNDLPTVLQLIHPQASSVRQQAEAELPNWEFHQCNVKSNLEISFDKAKQPTEAVARFNVLVVVSQRDGLLKNRRIPRYCTVTFRKHDGTWRVFAYQHDDAREGLLQR